MPRTPRLIPPEGFLHVICRGNNRRKIFLCKRDFRIYRGILKKLKAEESIEILHYCFMPNHIHLLLKIVEYSNLSRFMQRLNVRYSLYYHKKRRYTGHLWQDRFKSKLITNESYLMQCGKYIELNPVKAGIAKRPEDYPYSSYGYYALGKKDDLSDGDPLYLGLSENETERRIIYRNLLVEEDVKNLIDTVVIDCDVNS